MILSYIFIYIPLCFYFISVCPRDPVIILYLHSTMLLLYRILFQVISLVYLFTFHYASTLSNRFPRHYAGAVHLHSTMLLLYLWISPVSRFQKFIYIPLCFYFIRNDWKWIAHCSLIYIPLCFYFIRVKEAGLSSRAIKFTFHYASTLSPDPPCLMYPQSSFTFHYASTLSDIDTLFEICSISFTFHYASTLSIILPSILSCTLDLHSTMLLLYHGLPAALDLQLCHLHSTMLLLYRGRKTNRKYREQFTFHYASTLSSDPAARVPTAVFIYIPLCFYFIRSFLSSAWLHC